MGYEKPSTKLTFYKAFFSAQWKFLIHTIVQCMSAKRTAWNDFSSSMASAIIYLAIVMINAQVDDLFSHNTKYTSSALTQKVFTNLRRIEDEVDNETCATLTKKVVNLEQDKIAQALEIIKLKWRVRKLEKKRRTKHLGLKRLRKDTDEAEPVEVKEVLEVVTAAKLMTEVVTTAAPITIDAQVTKASALRKRRGVIIQDPKETAAASVIMHTEVKPKDKRKGILIEEPKPLKRKAQIKQDKAFARQLEAELNANINWNEVIEQVKRKEKQDNEVMMYQALKRKPLTEAQARKNMMIYLKNMVGFKMNFFKGMTYSEIIPIFEKHYNSIQAFLEKGEEEREDEEEEELKRHLQIMVNDDGDVYTEATPLASKNFDREDLETLWKLVKERFKSTKPKNFSDDFLLNTFKIMFEKLNVEANVWKEQKTYMG
nr:hypothetical protein [Tanacetum cinerariifolium]